MTSESHHVDATPDWIEVDMSWVRALNSRERALFAEQAFRLGAIFEERSRAHITGVFLNLMTVALVVKSSSASGGVGSVIPVDPDEPSQHLRDELGTLAAHVLQLARVSSLPAVGRGWTKVAQDLQTQITALS
jgi:hypothetical protein